uniref:Uncharacterized protein n=1 Tax=Timema douglasi TaxID=61478 RepID=A0A7R8VZ17_TIMDO|nr:unnamed protein product [Timema douglasi]
MWRRTLWWGTPSSFSPTVSQVSPCPVSFSPTVR